MQFNWFSSWLLQRVACWYHDLQHCTTTRGPNNAAKVVCQAFRYCCPRPLLKLIHWLPVQQRIEYKNVLLTVKALHYTLPNYIYSLITPYQPTVALRCSGQNRLTLPTTSNRTVLARRAHTRTTLLTFGTIYHNICVSYIWFTESVWWNSFTLQLY